MIRKTDMALEAKRLYERSTGKNDKLEGVHAQQSGYYGVPVEIVEILDDRGEKALGKPRGTYVTISVKDLRRSSRTYFRHCAEAVSSVLRDMLGDGKNLLVAGLGNRYITPDAVGPMTLPNLIVTRHLQQEGGTPMAGLGCLSAVAPGVLGTTGIESTELVHGAAQTVGADHIIVVDALASCEPEHLCTSVQITDTGLVPGSGIRNSRLAFSRKELGVPVIAIGVPTVVDGCTLSSLDACDDKARRELILTPRSIDAMVKEMGKLIGMGIDLAAHRGLSFEDVAGFLS